MSTMRWIPLLFALAYVLPLHAENFQKCRGEGGATAYRSKGCLSGETLVAVLEPVADPPQAQRRVAAESPARPSRTARTSKRQTSRKARHGKRSSRKRKDPCPSAKQAPADFPRPRALHVTTSPHPPAAPPVQHPPQ